MEFEEEKKKSVVDPRAAALEWAEKNRYRENCECGFWYGDDGWKWRQTKYYELIGYEKDYIMRGHCPKCGNLAEFSHSGSVWSYIRDNRTELRKKKLEEEKKKEEERRRKDSGIGGRVKVSTECVICYDEIPKKRKGWSTCSEKCAVISKTKTHGEKTVAVVKVDGKWEVWTWEWEVSLWELVKKCDTRKEAMS